MHEGVDLRLSLVEGVRSRVHHVAVDDFSHARVQRDLRARQEGVKAASNAHRQVNVYKLVLCALTQECTWTYTHTRAWVHTHINTNIHTHAYRKTVTD